MYVPTVTVYWIDFQSQLGAAQKTRLSGQALVVPEDVKQYSK